MLTIPFPPSVNRLWRQFRGRTILSKIGRDYRLAVAVALDDHGFHEIPSPIEVEVKLWAYVPDGRRRDLDNMLKASLDALTACGIWEDDSQIKKLSIEHCGIDRANPRLVVEVIV